MNLEEKSEFIVFTKRGTRFQPWAKESINEGNFSEDQLTNYLKIYLDHNKWDLVKNVQDGKCDKYIFRAIPHPESEEAQKRESFFYSLFAREDYMHIKVQKNNSM